MSEVWRVCLEIERPTGWDEPQHWDWEELLDNGHRAKVVSAGRLRNEFYQRINNETLEGDGA